MCLWGKLFHSLPIRICNLEKNDITKYRIMQAHIVLIKALAEFLLCSMKDGVFRMRLNISINVWEKASIVLGCFVLYSFL